MDSETDVIAFADAMIQIMEKAQSPIQEESNQDDPNSIGKIGDLGLVIDPTQIKGRNRTSTPVPVSQIGGGDESSTSLEANLRVAPTSRTQLTELLPLQSSDEQETLKQASAAGKRYFFFSL